MERKQNWYMQGWEYAESISDTGKQKRVLRYVGEYYAVTASKTKVILLKSVCALSVLLLGLIFYGLSSANIAVGRMTYAHGPYLLTLIPLIYLVIGVVCFFCAPRKMTYRTYYGSVLRIKRASTAVLILTAASFLGNAARLAYAFFARNAGIAWRWEMIWMGGLLFSAILSAVIWGMLARLPIDILAK